MNEPLRPDGLTKDHLYCVGAAPSLRWQGVKGKEVFVEVATYDAPHVTIQSMKRGRIEFPVADIVELRAGVEYWKRPFYRCQIRRQDGPKIVFYGTNHTTDYRALILHLAEEMQGLGRFDRVRRGLSWWQIAGNLLFWGGWSLVLLLVVHDSWLRWGAGWQRDDYLLMGGIGLFALALLISTIWTWLRWYRPRRARDLEDLAKVLP